MKYKFNALVIIGCALLLIGCISSEQEYDHPLYDTSSSAFPVQQFDSFSEYQQTVQAWLEENRVFLQDDHAAELSYNTPFEIMLNQANSVKKGIIFVHGLGDSPWSFVDVAKEFADDGYLVRSVLLPGHGSRPADLVPISISDWENTVKNQVEIMQKEGLEVSLSGFSTGANLVTDYANSDPSIEALYLFSPAFKSDSDIDFLAPAGALFVDWVFQNDPKNHNNQMKYNSVPLNGFAQYYWSSYEVQKSLERKSFDRPAFLAVTQDDSVVNVTEVLRLFETQFTNASSRFIWFGDKPDTLDKRVVHFDSRVPSKRISNFSHMSLLYREDNFYYGANGEFQMCHNSIDPLDYEACLNSDVPWYSAWGYKEEGKIHARLTYNPYFDEMLDYAKSITAL
ncbi:alpha/beta hydrolase [Vibrio splendidus]